MLGVVACETYYSELAELLDGRAADVRYVPQEYHEFPVNVPVETEVRAAVRSRVDALDRPDVDRIVVVYARNGGVAGVTAETPLVVSAADDCIAAFVHDVEPWTMGEPKAFGTYYLTRGLIDRGVDAYKLHAGFVGRVGDLLEPFEAAAADHPGMRVDWHQSERFSSAVNRRDLDPEQAGRFVHRILQYYERVKLVDTGTLRPVHHEYADSFRAFVADLSAEYGDGHAVDLEVIEGDRSLLETLLESRPDGSVDAAFVETYAPGETVG